jgi:hypothetical protein
VINRLGETDPTDHFEELAEEGVCAAPYRADINACDASLDDLTFNEQRKDFRGDFSD